MAEESVWSLAKCNLSLSGIQISAGASDGDFFKITPEGDWRSVTAGVQGDIVISELAARTATFEITLLQTAKVNGDLQALLNHSMQQDGDVGAGSLIFEDTSGSVTIRGKGVLTKPPEFSGHGAAGSLVWTGTAYGLTWKVGGE